MDIATLDSNLASCSFDNSTVEWISAHDKRISLHGVFYDKENQRYIRVPDEVADASKQYLYVLTRMTAGGRVRFVTDSDFIAIKAAVPAFSPAPHMSITLTHGFSVYADSFFRARYSPTFNDLRTIPEDPFTANVCFAEKKVISDSKKKRVIDIYFPLYGGVSELFVGVSPGSVIETAPPYINKKPMVFYGSSITQGACVTRPGNDYVATIARKLNMDFINLGFSGSGNCEEAMLEYINSIDACLFAYDYNMYQNKKDRVLPPHFSIYEMFRNSHPDAAILLYDKPGCDYESYPEREEIIYQTYQKALALGDNHVGYVPAKDLLGETDRDSCMVDCSHPSDLGAMRMADALIPVIEKILKK